MSARSRIFYVGPRLSLPTPLINYRHDYEITCADVDFLVDTAAGIPGCYGARVTGGGFGVCTVNLVAAGAVERFRIAPAIFRCVPAAGAGEILSEKFRPVSHHMVK